MRSPEFNPKQQIEAINNNIRTIIGIIEWEVALKLNTSGSDNVGAAFELYLMAAQQEWPNWVEIPNTKAQAISILDNPNSSVLEKLGAKLYAELYKKSQLETVYGIESDKDAVILGRVFDND